MRPIRRPAAAARPATMAGLLAVLIAALPAAAQSERPGGGGAEREAESPPAAPVAPEAATRDVVLSLGAGPEGSAAHALATRIAEQVTAAAGWTVQVETTAGDAVNAILIQEGRIDLALVGLDVAWSGVQGEIAMAPGLSLDRMHGLAPVAATLLRVEPVGAELPSGAADGIGGLRIGAAVEDEALAALLGAFEGVRTVPLEEDAFAGAIAEGEIDAVAVLHPGGEAAAAEGRPPPIGAGAEEIAAARAVAPWLVPDALRVPLPPDADPAVTTPLPPIPTVALWTWLVARADLDTETARLVTAAAIAAIAEPADPNAAPVLPIHAGAAAAWKAAGIAIPAARVGR